jgi:RNA polymerase sigma factor (TIGR02999 family)
MQHNESDEAGESADDLRQAFAAGDESAAQLTEAGLTEMLPQIYEELRSMAAGHLRNERGGHTLQPTALVHETYLRLLGQRTGLKNRAHFLALSARMMRRILVTYAHNRGAQKRGGDAERVALDDALGVFEEKELPALEVNQALTALEQRDPRQAHIVELRFFGGLSVEETAEVLGISTATVKREWKVAKIWLRREMAHVA